MFQSSFELTCYITVSINEIGAVSCLVSKLFRAYGLYNGKSPSKIAQRLKVSKLFRAYGLYNLWQNGALARLEKFQSSFELTGYITNDTNDIKLIRG